MVSKRGAVGAWMRKAPWEGWLQAFGPRAIKGIGIFGLSWASSSMVRDKEHGEGSHGASASGQAVDCQVFCVRCRCVQGPAWTSDAHLRGKETQVQAPTGELLQSQALLCRSQATQCFTASTQQTRSDHA